MVTIYAYLYTYVKNILGRNDWGGNGIGGETTRVCGAKRLRLKIEAKRLGGKRPGGNVLGAKRLVTDRVSECSMMLSNYRAVANYHFFTTLLFFNWLFYILCIIRW